MLNIIYIKKIVESLVDYIYEDIENNPKEETSFLYRLLKGTVDKSYDFYEQSKKIFSRNPNNPNNIKISLEYPKDRTALPCYVIREPGKVKGPVNPIGKIEGVYTDTGDYRYIDSRQSNYEIMCFASNMMESILLSEVLYYLLVGAHDLLIDKFDTIDYQMKELMVENSLIPTPIFIKSISIIASSTELVPGVIDYELLGKVFFERAEIAAKVDGENKNIQGMPGASSEII